MTDHISLSVILKLLGLIPKIGEQAQQWVGHASTEDQERLVQYCRLVDNRRVFSAPFNVEVVESCVASLVDVKRYTEEALSKLEHGTAQACLGGILDHTRTFIDKWHGYRGQRHWGPFPGHGSGGPGEDDRAFFQDLGELRGRMKILIGLLTELAPSATAPQLLGS